jgi:hypothetical protein
MNGENEIAGLKTNIYISLKLGTVIDFYGNSSTVPCSFYRTDPKMPFCFGMASFLSAVQSLYP